MANLHILTKTGAELAVAAHIAIPATNNTAGIAWRLALINSGIGGHTVLPDGDGTAGTILAAEKASIASGALYEALETIHVSIPSGAVAVNAWLDAAFQEISARTIARLQDMLIYFGYVR